MSKTLEQLRAQNAWDCATQVPDDLLDSYSKLAKGLPAMIMNSGLMQTLAFLHEKSSKPGRGKSHEGLLAQHLRAWIASRHPGAFKQRSDFASFMDTLFKAEPWAFQQYTAEAYAWLRWIRQIAAACSKSRQTSGEAP